MASNLEKQEAALHALAEEGADLFIALLKEAIPDRLADVIKQLKGGKEGSYAEVEGHRLTTDGIADALRKVPSFKRHYQPWYSEAHAVVKQLLPDRLVDFEQLLRRRKVANPSLTETT